MTSAELTPSWLPFRRLATLTCGVFIVLQIFNMPVNLAQGTSVMYAFIIGFSQAPLTALQVRLSRTPLLLRCSSLLPQAPGACTSCGQSLLQCAHCCFLSGSKVACCQSPAVAQVLLVNLVTSTTLGLALAAEPAEPTVMEQPPRRPNKRLVGKLLLWRMFFVCHVIVCLVLGMFAWAQAGGHTLGQSRAEAFNILVGSQVCGQRGQHSVFVPACASGLCGWYGC